MYKKTHKKASRKTADGSVRWRAYPHAILLLLAAISDCENWSFDDCCRRWRRIWETKSCLIKISTKASKHESSSFRPRFPIPRHDFLLNRFRFWEDSHEICVLLVDIVLQIQHSHRRDWSILIVLLENLVKNISEFSHTGFRTWSQTVKLYLVNFPNQCDILSSNIFQSSVARGKNLWNFWNFREFVRSLSRVCVCVCVRRPSPKQTQSEALIAFWRRGCSWSRRLISRDSTPALLALHDSGLKLFCASSGDDPQASLSLSLSQFFLSCVRVQTKASTLETSSLKFCIMEMQHTITVT